MSAGNERRLLIVGNCESDLANILCGAFAEVQFAPANAAVDYAAYSAVAVLGGNLPDGITLLPSARCALEHARRQGVRVFAEYSRVTDEVSFANPVPTQFSRPVCMGATEIFSGLQPGDILDEQWNERLPVQHVRPSAQPILQYVDRPDGLTQTASLPEKNGRDFALWLEEECLLICTFRMDTFLRARFAPRRTWCALIAALIAWLGGDCSTGQIYQSMEDYCTFSRGQTISGALTRAGQWFQRANLLAWDAEGSCAVLEGVSSRVLPDGSVLLNRQIRTDCMGTTALFFLLQSLRTGDEQARKISEGLFSTVRGMQVAQGTHRGFVRGSLGWWGSSSYQDDTARGFLFPLLIRRMLTGDRTDDERLRSSLAYLLRTTGQDGLRPNQVEYTDPDSDVVWMATTVKRGGKWRHTQPRRTTCGELRNRAVHNPSAHYNAYYLGALALAGAIFLDDEYIAVAQKGLAAIMQAYPDTAREHSQTQECCRLLMPLALLYLVTGNPKHREWLERVAEDLETWAHPCGGYMEWDEGYTGVCSRSSSGESAIYLHNGDPVCDLLYSANWLPQAFAIAYWATGAEKYRERWERMARFLADVQLKSAQPALDGGWARAVNLELGEVHGINNDSDWACWTIESGWTVAQIGVGLLFGVLAPRLKPLFLALRELAVGHKPGC